MFRYYRELGERQRKKREEIDEEKLRKLKLENDEASGDLVLIKKVYESLSAAIVPIREALRQKFEHDLPMAMSGMELPICRIYGKKAYDELAQKISVVFSNWKI